MSLAIGVFVLDAQKVHIWLSNHMDEKELEKNNPEELKKLKNNTNASNKSPDATVNFIQFTVNLASTQPNFLGNTGSTVNELKYMVITPTY
ncbi:hypothetical protein [Vibrio penaeicida]|uniref:hypothetical protein n=1 Tax=Vibrio penaeicida TaxID=104609 RepID=UPI00163C6278|nr:hypothetical protein [Vibrio penaeicida]